MVQEKRSPKWWQLYVMLPLLVGLFWPEMHLPLTQTGHILAQLGILLLIWGFMQLWLRANRSAFLAMDEQEGQWEIFVHQIPDADFRAWEQAEEPTSHRTILHIPASGLKGVLSDTFEWEAPEEESSVFSDQGVAAHKE